MKRHLVMVAIGLLTLGSCSTLCNAQMVPYNLFGVGQADPLGGLAGMGAFFGPAVEDTIGPMTYFAEATKIEVLFDLGGAPIGFVYEAIDTQTAWDGSEVFLEGIGSAVLIPRPDLGPTWFEAVWDGKWSILGGSGRFDNAGPGTKPIDLFLYFYAFDLNDMQTLRPFYYTKIGEWNLGNKPIMNGPTSIYAVAK